MGGGTSPAARWTAGGSERWAGASGRVGAGRAEGGNSAATGSASSHGSASRSWSPCAGGTISSSLRRTMRLVAGEAGRGGETGPAGRSVVRCTGARISGAGGPPGGARVSRSGSSPAPGSGSVPGSSCTWAKRRTRPLPAAGRSVSMGGGVTGAGREDTGAACRCTVSASCRAFFLDSSCSRRIGGREGNFSNQSESGFSGASDTPGAPASTSSGRLCPSTGIGWGMSRLAGAANRSMISAAR